MSDDAGRVRCVPDASPTACAHPMSRAPRTSCLRVWCTCPSHARLAASHVRGPSGPRPAPSRPPALLPRIRVTIETGASDLKAVEQLKDARERIMGELRKVIIGQDEVVEQLLTALFANGHVLLVGVPGLAKTLLISSLARVLDLKFNRIQFTPDLMPTDITGTEVIEEDQASGKRIFRFIQGPVFANIVLADEINRTPPKTQAALLQAMQERKVTVGGQTYPLPQPF